MLYTNGHLESSDSPNFSDEQDQLTIESLLGSGDVSQEIATEEDISLKSDDVAIKRLKEGSSAEPETIENGIFSLFVLSTK